MCLEVIALPFVSCLLGGNAGKPAGTESTEEQSSSGWEQATAAASREFGNVSHLHFYPALFFVLISHLVHSLWVFLMLSLSQCGERGHQSEPELAGYYIQTRKLCPQQSSPPRREEERMYCAEKEAGWRSGWCEETGQDASLLMFFIWFIHSTFSRYQVYIRLIVFIFRYLIPENVLLPKSSLTKPRSWTWNLSSTEATPKSANCDAAKRRYCPHSWHVVLCSICENDQC